MIAVLQRVNNAKVEIDGRVCGECGKGLLILLGIAEEDNKKDAELLTAKISKLRIFSDGDGKMNLSVGDIGGEALIISNFTLYANYKKGNRPDFLSAAKPKIAEPLYDYFIECMQANDIVVSHGEFGADMQVFLQNDGPVTIVMDSGVLSGKDTERVYETDFDGEFRS